MTDEYKDFLRMLDESEHFSFLLSSIEDSLFNKIKGSETGDSIIREEAYNQIKAIEMIKTTIHNGVY